MSCAEFRVLRFHGWAALVAVLTPVVWAAGPYRSPRELAYSPDGATIAVGDYTAGRLVLMKADGSLTGEVVLRGSPSGVAWNPGGDRLYVAERGAWTVAEVDPRGGKVLRRFAVGRYPVGVAVSQTHLVVANNGLDQVSVVDLASGKETRVPDVYRPWGVALTPDGKTAVVGGLVPRGDARGPGTGSVVTLVDVAAANKGATIALPPGSINVHGVAVSPDGKWAYVGHSVGRFTLPTTQLERGWVMTHAMSILDLTEGKLFCTVLLDSLTEGGADPWGVAVAPDGKTVYVALAGVHQVAEMDVGTLHQLLSGTMPDDMKRALPGNSTWHAVVKDPGRRSDLVNDLAALYSAGLIRRYEVGDAGPRGVAVSPDGKTLAVACYFGGRVLLVGAGTAKARARVEVGPQPAAGPERLGEQYFFDARQCFQHWLSCGSCHPEGRADGLNWDLLNDGMGNPKNTKSLVLSHLTPPVMSTGVRPSMEAATMKGFTLIQFRIVDDTIMESVRAYQRSLRPEPSPYLKQSDKNLSCDVCHHARPSGPMGPGHMAIGGELTDEARKGLALFKDAKIGCARCHPGPLLTDMKMYDVGTRHELDRRDDFDTPTCYEMWRTAPFLHDGSAVTIEEMLTKFNEQDQHGVTRHLSPAELEALAAYLRSL